MSRSRLPLVVHSDSMRIPLEALPKLHEFQRWLLLDLARLEAKWANRAAPQDKSIKVTARLQQQLWP